MRGGKEIAMQVNYNDSMCIAANSIFFNMWNCFLPEDCFEPAFDSRSELYALGPDPDDIF